MIRIRRSEDRGHFDHGWLDTRHSFSFADYFDPEHVQFGALRVINEDLIQPGQAFGMHSHRDMEILSFVVAGSLEHHDSLGNGSIIRPDEVQRMTAGTGVRHSERNPSDTERTHLLQVWILPERVGLPPSYEQVRFDPQELRGRLRVVASKDAREGSVLIHQDASVHRGVLLPGASLRHEMVPGRQAWIQVVRGTLEVDGQSASAGDGLAVTGQRAVTLTPKSEAEVLLFDLAAG
jgi:redox-sensitive bicupin YhaK (pirin superfamily)